jgi:hypothetical protein
MGKLRMYDTTRTKSDIVPGACFGLLTSEVPVSEAAPEPYLNLTGLTEVLRVRFKKDSLHTDTIRRRLRLGLPYHVDRASGRKLYLASEVIAWWVKPAPGVSQAS